MPELSCIYVSSSLNKKLWPLNKILWVTEIVRVPRPAHTYKCISSDLYSFSYTTEYVQVQYVICDGNKCLWNVSVNFHKSKYWVRATNSSQILILICVWHPWARGCQKAACRLPYWHKRIPKLFNNVQTISQQCDCLEILSFPCCTMSVLSNTSHNIIAKKVTCLHLLFTCTVFQLLKRAMWARICQR